MQQHISFQIQDLRHWSNNNNNDARYAS